MKTIKTAMATLLFAAVLSVNAQVTTTISSTGVGVDNGVSITMPGNAGGDNCTFLGYQAGMNDTNKDLGHDNTFVGDLSGKANTTGNFNTFMGSSSGLLNTTGSENSYFGNLSGRSNTTGRYNTFVGNESGFTNTTGEHNTFLGRLSGHFNTTGVENTFFGSAAGWQNSTGSSNTFGGNQAGVLNTIGAHNTFLGHAAGFNNTTGGTNVFIGSSAGHGNTTGSFNIYMGFQSGFNTSSGSSNIFIGHGSGLANTTGFQNTYLGFQSGLGAIGSGNIFLGSAAGQNETSGNKLIIDNTFTSTPLIWGDLANDQLKFHAKVGIGGNGSTAFGAFPTTAGGVNVSAYNLFVKGGILTEEVRVNLVSGWADYVFAKDYQLKPLAEVEKFISENGHLPNVPSAKQVKEDGIELGNMAKIQQEKIEELTLYLIQQDKEIAELKAQMKVLLEKKQ